MELILRGIGFIHVKKLKTSEFLCVGDGHPCLSTHFKHANNMAAVSRGWKVESCFKNLHFMWHSRRDSILGFYSILGINFYPHNPSKITGLGKIMALMKSVTRFSSTLIITFFWFYSKWKLSTIGLFSSPERDNSSGRRRQSDMSRNPVAKFIVHDWG